MAAELVQPCRVAKGLSLFLTIPRAARKGRHQYGDQVEDVVVNLVPLVWMISSRRHEWERQGQELGDEAGEAYAAVHDAGENVSIAGA